MGTDMEPQQRPAAWYPDPSDHTRQRWWDGTGWTDWTLPAPAQVHVTETFVPVQTNHTFHLLMTVFTCGLWGLVWLVVWALNQGKTRREISRTR